MDVYSWLEKNLRPSAFSSQPFALLREGEWTRITRDQFRKDVETCAKWIHHLSGWKSGGAVAIIGGCSYPWIIWDLALMRCGLVVEGLFHGAKCQDLLKQLRDSDVSGVICADEEVRSRLASELDVPVRAMKLPESSPLDGLALPVPPSPESPAIRVTTSGTTGEPKSFFYSHRQLIDAIQAVDRHFGDHSKGLESTLCWLPLAFMTGRMVNYVSQYWGMRIHILEDPKRIGEELRRVQPELFLGVPRFYEKVFAELERLPGVVRAFLTMRFVASVIRKRVFGGRLRIALSGSAPLDSRIDRFFRKLGQPVLEAYALSECAIPIAMSTPSLSKPGSVGRILPGQEVQFDAAGQILLRSSGLHSRATLLGSGYFATGDLGHLDSQGFLHVDGRIKDLIKTSTGHRISPIEMENGFGADPRVQKLVVVGNGRPYLSGLVFLSEEACERYEQNPQEVSMAVEAWIEVRNSELPKYKRIQGFAIIGRPLSVEAGDYTDNFKLKRAKLEKEFSAEIAEIYQSRSARRAGNL